MDLQIKYHELTKLLERYLNGEVSNEVINKFVWDIIDFFSDTPKEKLPPAQLFEKTFWYAIWRIQHLADDEHFNDESCKQELLDCLSYLKLDKPLPDTYIGRRP